MKDTLCSVVGCFRKPRRRGYCNAHWLRWKRGTSLEKPLRARNNYRHPCSQFGCSKPHAARGLCATHYKRWSRLKEGHGGTPMAAPPRRTVKLVRLPGALAEPHVVALVKKKAAETGLTASAVQREVLKLWAEGLLRPLPEEDIHG